MGICHCCKNLAHSHVLINNDGVCNDCRSKIDKDIQEKITLNAYEYMELDKRMSKFRKTSKDA